MTGPYNICMQLTNGAMLNVQVRNGVPFETFVDQVRRKDGCFYYEGIFAPSANINFMIQQTMEQYERNAAQNAFVVTPARGSA